MRTVRGLLAIGAMMLGGFVSSATVAPSQVRADTWVREEKDCPSGSICRETHCTLYGSEQCTAQYCTGTGCS